MLKVYEKSLPYFEPNSVHTVGKPENNDVQGFRVWTLLDDV